MPAAWIPILFAVAMGVDGVGALALGSLFDRIGIRTMILARIVSAAAAPLVFLGNFPLAVIGMACWASAPARRIRSCARRWRASRHSSATPPPSAL
jgi:hypothetical protein